MSQPGAPPRLPAAPAPVATTPVSAGWRSPAAVVRVRGSAVARHLHAQLAAVQHGPIHGVHGVFGVTLVVEADEGEAAGFLSVAVPRDVYVADAPVLLEDAPQGVGRGAVGQVVHLEGGHALHIGRRAAVTHGPGASAGPCDCAPRNERPGRARAFRWGGGGFLRLARLHAAPLLRQLASAWNDF